MACSETGWCLLPLQLLVQGYQGGWLGRHLHLLLDHRPVELQAYLLHHHRNKHSLVAGLGAAVEQLRQTWKLEINIITDTPNRFFSYQER